jgi:four helix bundle protein
MASHYRELIAWQKAMDLVNAVYDATEAFPKREVYSLTDQIRRAAVSIPSNIAEGQAHYSNREFVHYLRHFRGSLAELETQILISQRRNYISDTQAAGLLKQTDEVGRILSGLINSLKRSEKP